MPSSNRGEKRNRKVLIIIPGPFAPKHIDIYVEKTLKAVAKTQSAEGAVRVQDVYEDMRPKMKEMDMRMALVTLTTDFGRPVRPMLPSAGTSGVVCANWTCEDFRHFAVTVAVPVLGDMFDSAEHQHLAVLWHMLQGAVIHYLRDCEECDAPADSEECRRVNEYIKKQRDEDFNCLLTYEQMCSMQLPDDTMKLNLHNLVCRVRAQEAARGSTARDSELWMERTWEAAGADDGADMFEGTGPGCKGAAVQAGTSGAPAPWTDCEVVHEKPETRMPVVFKHKTWDEQWVPTDEYIKQAILRDRRAEVEHHDNDVYVGEGLYFLESKAPLRPNLRKGHDAFPVALKHIEENSKDKAVLSVVFDECWPRDTQTGIPYPPKKTHRFPIAAPPCTERICYTTFNYLDGYPADNGNARSYLARYYFQDEVKDGQGGRKNAPLPSADGLAKALDLAEAWNHSELGRYYQAGKCPPANVMFKGEEEVCEMTPHSEGAAVPGDNVDEGSSPEPPAKKAKQPAKPAAGGLA
eukprot:jgi/Tetstr1/426969/TSEL_017182.t1